MSFSQYHITLLKDKIRMSAFNRAIKKAVTHNSIVADLGAGTGILGLLALKYGAKKVFFVEKNRSILEVAKQIIKSNGLVKQAVFFNDVSTNVKFPQKANMIITETIGSLGFDEDIVTYILDLKKRNMITKSCNIIPHKLITYAALGFTNESSLNKQYWENLLGLNFAGMIRFIKNSLKMIEFKNKCKFFSLPKIQFSADFSSPISNVEDFPLVNKTKFVINKTGKINAIFIWFKAFLSKSIFIDSLNDNMHWQLIALPINQIKVCQNDVVKTELIAENSHSYSWITQIYRKNSLIYEDASSTSLSYEALKLLSSVNNKAVPKLSVKDRDELKILNTIDNKSDISAILKKMNKQNFNSISNNQLSQFIKKTIIKYNLLD